MSPSACESEWAVFERNTVISRDPTNRERRFVAVLLEHCAIPDTIRRYRYMDYRRESREVFSFCKGDSESVFSWRTLEPPPRPSECEPKSDCLALIGPVNVGKTVYGAVLAHEIRNGCAKRDWSLTVSGNIGDDLYLYLWNGVPPDASAGRLRLLELTLRRRRLFAGTRAYRFHLLDTMGGNWNFLGTPKQSCEATNLAMFTTTIRI